MSFAGPRPNIQLYLLADNFLLIQGTDIFCCMCVCLCVMRPCSPIPGDFRTRSPFTHLSTLADKI